MEKYPKNIISFVAKKSGSGKTSIIEKVIEELKKRDLKVTVIKHTSPHLASIDQAGKDTYKFAQKGADRIMLFSDNALSMYELKKPDLAYLVNLALKDTDIVIIEGYKESPFKKIEVFNSEANERPMCMEQKQNDFISIISRKKIDAPIPCYLPDETSKICDLIIKTCIKEQT